MPDLFDLFFRWWKQVLLLMIAAVVVAGIIVLFTAKKYLGIATALPAPAYASDKTAVFSQNLQELYSTLGTPDDLDKIMGTAHLDTVYIAVIEKLDLSNHYGLANSDAASVQKAAHVLKRRTRVIKTDYGELQVKTWDTDRYLAAVLANNILEKLQQLHQDVQTANNLMMLSKINNELDNSKTEFQKLHDSLSRIEATSGAAQILGARQSSLVQQMQEYEKLANQYKLMVDARPQSLIVIERARPATYAYEPKPLQVILIAAVLSLFFGLLSAVLLERRRTRPK